MPRVFQVFRRRRRRRLLLRPSLQTTSLRHHGFLSNHPDQHPRLPANDTPAGLAALHLRCGDLPRAEALLRAAPASASARDAHLDTRMLNGLVKAGRLDHARRLFDGMAAKDVVAWSTLLSGYCRAGRLGEARALYDAMPAQNVVLGTALLQGYGHAGMLREAREMFDAMTGRSMMTWTVMLNTYAVRGHYLEAMELFDRMPRRDSYSWNAMISCFLRAGRVDEAVGLFVRMPHRTVVSWTAMVTGLAQNGRVSMARDLFNRMPENKDITAWNAMITAYAKDGQMSEARKLFDSMPAKDQWSWNIVINGYAKNNLKDKAVGLFLSMLRSAVSPDSTTLISLLVTSGSTVEVGQMHGMATKLGHMSETFLGTALLTMYSRSGDVHYARQSFKMLQDKDAITWTSMMQAFANHGCASYALQAFAQMLRHGHDPSSATFTAALSACRHAGLVEKGQSIFRSIFAYGLKPTIEHRYILGRTARAMEATEAVAAMPPETCGPEMELKKKKKRRKKKSTKDRRFVIEEPAGLEAATQCTPRKAATISVAAVQASCDVHSKKNNEKKESAKDGRLAIEEPAGLEAAAAAATQCTPTKAATISVATLQASLGRLWSKTVSYLRRR